MSSQRSVLTSDGSGQRFLSEMQKMVNTKHLACVMRSPDHDMGPEPEIESRRISLLKPCQST